ncbi:unnamed protein product [Amoebophrya sp. A120]|nr:unnamed protein product [Amoebophrya sp. A120]|eukprot:GSA120T00004670001.1
MAKNYGTKPLQSASAARPERMLRSVASSETPEGAGVTSDQIHFPVLQPSCGSAAPAPESDDRLGRACGEATRREIQQTRSPSTTVQRFMPLNTQGLQLERSRTSFRHPRTTNSSSSTSGSRSTESGRKNSISFIADHSVGSPGDVLVLSPKLEQIKRRRIKHVLTQQAPRPFPAQRQRAASRRAEQGRVFTGAGMKVFAAGGHQVQEVSTRRRSSAKNHDATATGAPQEGRGYLPLSNSGTIPAASTSTSSPSSSSSSSTITYSKKKTSSARILCKLKTFFRLFLSLAGTAMTIPGALAQSYPGGLAHTSAPHLEHGWTDNSYAKIIANSEKILKSNVYIHRLLAEDQIQANYGRAHYNKKYPFTLAWHLQRQSGRWVCSLPEKANDESLKSEETLLSVLNTLFSRFMHDKLLEYHDLEPAKYVSSRVEIDLATKIPHMDLADSQLLRWMVNLVVDLHYPFNLGFPDAPEDTLDTMYNLDQQPLAKLWTSMQDKIILAIDSNADLDETKNIDISDQHPFELFFQWASETTKIACDIYRDVSSNSDEFPKQYMVSAQVYAKWEKILQKRMEEAAKHVVIFLKNIALHKAHRKAVAQGKGRHHPRKHWKRDFFRNLCVAAVLIPAFLWLMQKFEKQQNIFKILFNNSKYAEGWGSAIGGTHNVFGGATSSKELRKL